MTKFKRSIPRLLCSLAVGVLLLDSSAHAQFAYVSTRDTQFGTVNRLGLLNLATGQTQVIGDLQFGFYGLQFVGGTLYGVRESGQFVPQSGGLFSIDTTTAATTFIQRLDDFNPGVVKGLPVPGALTLSTNGTLYNLQNPTDLAASSAHIYSVNINGASTTVAPLATVGGGTGNTGITGNGGLAFDPTNGLLYGTQGFYGDGLFSVNPGSGAVTTITTDSVFGIPNRKSVYSLFYNLDANSLYAIDYANAPTGNVYSVNKTTGQATVVTTYNTDGFGSVESAAFVSSSPVVPESGPVLLFGSALLSVLVLRKKKKIAQ